ncbi:hypothetical protein MMC09_000588 [Bachmanniomyces sp. S44760]|nr:hypothetical protein [Bachmanniomyces sp. S44760]
MDGLLINTEDIYTLCINTVLSKYHRPPLPWSIKAQLQGRPGPVANEIFQSWAKLPIRPEEYLSELTSLQREEFPHCAPLPGVRELLSKLGEVQKREGKGRVDLAVATSSRAWIYDLKTAHLRDLMSVFQPEQVVKGDDERIAEGRGKPAPDIYLLALRMINERIARLNRERRTKGAISGGRNKLPKEKEEEEEVTPEQCLVFEDSVPGVEAGRRAGMRVVWCPHPELLKEFKGREKEVLAGMIISGDEGKGGADVESSREEAVKGWPGMPDDGWAVLLETLENFPYANYGIDLDEGS